MLKTIQDFNVQNKRILVRCDFNVPLNGDGSIADDFKIIKTLPTIKYLVSNKAKVILMSHLDNPDNSVTSNLNVVRDRLEKLLAMPVKKTDDCVGEQVEKEVSELKQGEILLLENLRFHQEEFDNNHHFAEKLATLGDIYINDAFSVSHRNHASIVGVPEYIPHGAGFLLAEEMKNLNKVLENPERPLGILIGGAKVQTKSKFIEAFLKSADFVIVNALIKQELQKQHPDILEDVRMLFPEGDMDRLDIDGETIERFKKKILQSKTIVWNGPFGQFEDEQYKKGTLAIAKAIIESGAFSVVGGGETIEFLDKEGLLSKFSHVSTGGGAMLAYLSGEALPGIQALDK